MAECPDEIYHLLFTLQSCLGQRGAEPLITGVGVKDEGQQEIEGTLARGLL